jgi:transposase
LFVAGTRCSKLMYYLYHFPKEIPKDSLGTEFRKKHGNIVGDAIKGAKKWKEMLKHWIRYPFRYLKRYFKREASEANFSRDKRKHGVIKQKIKTRIINTSWARAILHNLAMKYIYS